MELLKYKLLKYYLDWFFNKLKHVFHEFLKIFKLIII